jgi:hypothetical protein
MGLSLQAVMGSMPTSLVLMVLFIVSGTTHCLRHMRRLMWIKMGDNSHMTVWTNNETLSK